MSKGSMAFRTDDMKVFLANVRKDPELQTAALDANITETILVEGDKLLSAALTAIADQDQLEADWNTVKAQLKSKREQLETTYKYQIRKARLDVHDPVLRQLLELDGRRDTTVVELSDQIRSFYQNGLNRQEALAALAKCGITREDLNKGLTDLAEIEELVSDELITRGKKESATQAQKAALDTMDAWHAHKMAGMEYATQHKPELMKRLRKQ